MLFSISLHSIALEESNLQIVTIYMNICNLENVNVFSSNIQVNKDWLFLSPTDYIANTIYT